MKLSDYIKLVHTPITEKMIQIIESDESIVSKKFDVKTCLNIYKTELLERAESLEESLDKIEAKAQYKAWAKALDLN